MLYFVATPIGNLKDISYRAVEVLKSVDEIACEDTRHSMTLLSAYGIKKPLFSYHKFNEKKVAEEIIEKLENGKNIAVISDAGTPSVSDPGNVLTEMLIEKGLDYTVIPGACALINAIVLSGLDSTAFCFLGFLPDKQSKRKEFLKEYADVKATLIFYSAPHDVVKNVADMYEVLGDRQAVAVREITKIHESAERFNLKDGLKSEPRGEYVILVEKAKDDNAFLSLSPEEHIAVYVKSGLTKKEALKRVAKERGVSKSELYKYTIDNEDK